MAGFIPRFWSQGFSAVNSSCVHKLERVWGWGGGRGPQLRWWLMVSHNVSDPWESAVPGQEPCDEGELKPRVL